MPFTVLPQPRPVITTLTPSVGKADDVVTINGNHLNNTSKVTLNESLMVFTQVSNTKLTAIVPEGAASGVIRVLTPAGQAASPQNFIVNNFTSEIAILQNGTFVADAKTLDLIGLGVTTGANPTIAVITNSAEINTASNLGSSGARVFSGKVGVDLRFRRLVAGSNINVTENTNDITITATAVGESNAGVNLGSSGGRVYQGKSGVNLNFRRLLAGSNITITENADNITFDATSDIEFSASNLGTTGARVFSSKVGTDLQFRRLLAGNNISLSEGGNAITIDATAAGETNTASNFGGGVGVFRDKSGVDLRFRSLVAGANTTITTNGDTITIANSAGGGESNTASNIGGGFGLFSSKVGVDLRFRSLAAGSNVTITPSGDALVIAANTTGEINTASNIGTGAGVFASKVGVDLRFRRILAGGNIAVTENANDITITATSVGEANTASNLGSTGIGLFSAKVAEDLRFKRIIAGSNITVTDGTEAITIAVTGAGEANTGSNLGTGAAVFAAKVGQDLRFRRIRGIGAVTVTENTNDISIETTAEANAAANLGVVGIGLFSAKVGSELLFKRLAAGTNIILDDLGDRVLISTIDISGGGGGGGGGGDSVAIRRGWLGL